MSHQWRIELVKRVPEGVFRLVALVDAETAEEARAKIDGILADQYRVREVRPN